MKKSEGFTVVQLLVVIFLIAILSLMAINMGKGPIHHSKFNVAINNFIADFTYAKTLASRENRYIQIRFNDNHKSYTLLKQTNIGNYNNWTPVKGKIDVFALGDIEFFNGSIISDFAVNSMGEVFTLPLAANSQPTPISLNFYYKDPVTGALTYTKLINIRPYGGISRE